MGTWSEFMPLGGKHIKDKSGKKNVTLKKSVSGKSVLGSLSGASYQKQLSGKNLLNVENFTSFENDEMVRKPVYNQDGTLNHIFINGVTSGRISLSKDAWRITTAGTYIGSGCPSGGSTNGYRCVFGKKKADGTFVADYTDVGNGVGFTITEEEASQGYFVQFFILIETGITLNNLQFRPMISAEGGDYEPYCGGTASPNPQFKQTIHSTGDSGWFDGEWVQGYCLNSGVVTKNTYCAYSKNSIPCKENDEITLKYDGVLSATTASAIVTFYDENDVYLSQVRATAEWLGELSATAPTGATNFKFDLRNNVNDVLPDLTAKTTITINGQYAVIVDEVGKNICSELWESGNINTSNGSLATSTMQIRSAAFDKVEPDTSYYVTIPRSAIVIVFYDKKYNFIKSNDAMWASGTFKTPTNARYIRYYMAEQYGTEYTNDIQIEKGKVGTPYTKHQSNRTYIPISEPLRSVGDVKDEICVQNGEYGVLRKINRYVFSGNEGWSHTSGWANTYAFIAYGIVEDAKKYGISALSTIMCNRLQVTTGDMVANKATTRNSIGQYNANLLMTIEEISVASDLTTYLSENETYIDYELATPVFEPFADQTPFYNLLSYDDVTNVSIVGLHENVEPTLQMFYPSSEDGVNVFSLFGNNSQLRFNDETGTIQVIDTDGDWIDIYFTDSIPVPAWDGSILGNILKFPASKWSIVNYTASGETSGGATLELSTQYLKLDRGSGVNYQSVLYLPVNVTNCKTLHITGHSVRLGSYYNVGDAWIQKVVPDGSKLNGGAGDIQSCRWNTGTAWIDPTSFTLDVSDLTGIYYICISNAGYEGYTEITELYFDLL